MPGRGPTLAVLVVDDDARIRRGLREMIEFAPDVTVVGEASSASTALQLDLALRPDVVVLDLLLPHAEDGLRVLSELRSRGTPVVAISGLGFLRTQALELGASSFMEKGSQLIGQLVQTIAGAVTGTTP